MDFIPGYNTFVRGPAAEMCKVKKDLTADEPAGSGAVALPVAVDTTVPPAPPAPPTREEYEQAFQADPQDASRDVLLLQRECNKRWHALNSRLAAGERPGDYETKLYMCRVSALKGRMVQESIAKRKAAAKAAAAGGEAAAEAAAAGGEPGEKEEEMEEVEKKESEMDDEEGEQCEK